MTGEMLFVFGILLATVVLFATDRVRLDIVAILVILALSIGGVLSAREAVAGFGDPVVLLIGGLFVVGESLSRTGIAHALGNWLMGVAGAGEIRLLVLMMLVVAALSAFMSSTGAVAIFVPVVLSIAARIGANPARLLMPLAISSLIGGMLTLIGTPPNLVASTALGRADLEPFSFFDFTPIGLLVLLVGIAYVVLLGKRLLPGGEAPGDADRTERRTMSDLAEAYGIADRFHRLRIGPGSPLAGKTIAEAMLRTRYGVTVLAIERTTRLGTSVSPVLISTGMLDGDVLYVGADDAQAAEVIEKEKLEPLDLDDKRRKGVMQELGMAEFMVTPSSPLIGKTLKHARFRERYGLSILGIQRKGRPQGEATPSSQLAFGDVILVAGGWKNIDLLNAQRTDFVSLTLPAEMQEVAPARSRAPIALLVMLGMLVLLTLGLMASVTAVLMAALAMVVFRCVSMEEAYRSINWQSIVLIAGMLPMATALEKTGGIQLIVDGLIAGVGAFGPYALMAGLFVVTSLFSQFISNTATTVLVAPIAIGAAQAMGLAPHALLMTVAIAASTAFSTPVASPVNMLVLGPGRYRFNDFVKIGVPLQLLAMIVTLLAVPVFFPL